MNKIQGHGKYNVVYYTVFPIKETHPKLFESIGRTAYLLRNSLLARERTL